MNSEERRWSLFYSEQTLYAGQAPPLPLRHSNREAGLTLLEIHAPFHGPEIRHRPMLCRELRQPCLAVFIQFAEGVLPLLMREERRGLRHRDPAALAARQFLQ